MAQDFNIMIVEQWRIFLYNVNTRSILKGICEMQGNFSDLQRLQ